MALTVTLSAFVDQDASHPIAEDLVNPTPWQLLGVFFMACVWAPVVEELMFRGALYHYIRVWAAPLVAGLAVAVVFAAIHPQGIAGIPMLTSIAVVMGLIREWRGTIIGSVTAHMLNNFTAITVSMLLMA